MKNLADEINKLAAKIQSSLDDENDEEDIENFTLFLKKATEFRNLMEKKMKSASPMEKQILRLQVIDLDNRIAQFKHGFRKFEEKCEEEKQAKAEEETKLDGLLDQVDLQAAKMYIIAKHQMPEDFFEGLKRAIVDNLPPALQKKFYETVAHLEATRLEDILAGK